MRHPEDSEAGTRSETPPRQRPEAVRIWLLGGFRVSVGQRVIGAHAWHLKKAASLVKLLALAPGHRMHRERVMDLLWPDLGKKAASNNLRQTLHAARRALRLDSASGSRYLVSEDQSLVLCPGGNLSVDVEVFEQAAEAASRARDTAAYRTAIELYAGELLPEDLYEEWAEGRRDGLRQTHVRLLVELAGLYEERGEYGRAVEALRKATANDPTLEEAYVGLMRLQALSGRPEGALAEYERLRDVLSRRLGTRPGAATRHLRDEIAAGTFPPTRIASIPQHERTDARKHNLPAPRTSFVGREHELVEVKRALLMTRLLTLTGAGGAGKTRLALEVAKDLVTSYPYGVWLVELAPLTEGELVPQAVAQALGVREQPGKPITATLAEALRRKDMLLILDNCEHLADSVAHLLDTLLDSCPHLRVLATSRETLGVVGEAVRRISSLSVPDTNRLPAVGELTHYDAVRLFLDRARLRLPDFDLTPENGRAVAQVCRGLEGIPLAIELATARVGTLSVRQISERLRDPLHLLSAGGRTTESRQQTLRGTLDWSYELLSESERVLFARLSVFAGGWPLEAIGAGDGIEEGEVLDLLSILVDKSLVVAETSAEDRVRYRMLEPVRQYGQEKLEESGEADAIGRRHALFFLALAEEAEPQLRGSWQGEWLERLEREYGNLQRTLSWALNSGEAELGLRVCGALGEFWYHRGHVSEGRRWLWLALAEREASSVSARAKALALAGWLAWEQGDYEQSEALIGEGLKLYRGLGDTAHVAAALFDLGMAALYQMKCERASAPLEEALALHDMLGDGAGVARTLYGLGMLAWAARQDYERATALYKEGLALAHRAGDNYGILLSLALGTVVSSDQSDYRKARELNKEGLELSRRVEMRRMIAFNLHLSATLASAQEQAVRSARLWGAAKTLREAIGGTFSPLQHYFYGPYIDAARTKLGEAVWEAAFAEGQAMTTEDAVEYALLDKEIALFTPRMPRSQQPATLTRREEEVAALVARGFTNRQIASELSISEHTVANHVAKILRKLGFDSRSQVTVWVVEQRLL